MVTVIITQNSYSYLLQLVWKLYSLLYMSSIVGAELSFFGSCFLLKNDAYMKYRLEPLAGRDGGLRARNADPLGWRAQVLKGKPLTS